MNTYHAHNDFSIDHCRFTIVCVYFVEFDTYCGWTTSCTTWKPWLKPFFVGISRGIISKPGSLGWCEMYFVHPTKNPAPSLRAPCGRLRASPAPRPASQSWLSNVAFVFRVQGCGKWKNHFCDMGMGQKQGDRKLFGAWFDLSGFHLDT